MTALCNYIIASESSIQDKTTGAWSVISMIETIGVPELGMAVPVHVLSLWTFPKERIGEKLTLRIVAKSAGGDTVFSPEAESSISGPRQYFRIIGVPSLPAVGEGGIFMQLKLTDTDEWIDSPHWPMTVILTTDEDNASPENATGE